MRVLKKMGRKALQAPPAVRAFMDRVMLAQEQDLAPLLQQFNKWTFPKGDLFQWVAVLDKCDAILESKCRQYALEKIQVKPFEEGDRVLLVAILAFTAFLLDHCANRSLYSSANNITELLNTTDIDVCEQTCRVTVRLAHRHNQQRNNRHPFGISSERILRLATSLQSATKDCGAIHIPMGKLLDSTLPLTDAWRSVHYWFYKQASESQQGEHKGDYFTLKTPSAVARQPQAVPATPTPAHGTSRSRFPQTPNTPATPGEALVPHADREGISMIQISAETLQAQPIEQILQTALEEHKLPAIYHFEFMLRVRLAKAANASREQLVKLVSIRALALAAMAYTVPEPVLQTRIFTTDGEVIQQLAVLINPDFAYPEGVRIAALNAVEAIAHHRPKLNDVLAVLGASVNHGLILYIVKRTLTDLQHEVPLCSSEYVEAVTNLLHFLSTTNLAGSMLCSAGLVQLLVQLLENRQPAALRAVVKSLTLLDHLLYGFQQSFQIFCSVEGPTILVERIRTEVLHDKKAAPSFEEACKVSKVDYRMPHERFSLLKTMLKTLLHMMQSSGTSDGLRNLIESSLLASINLIYENVHVFGSSVFATATNIMSTFIHNEPTSYQILHEKKVPETFLRSITQTILPASDSLNAIPNAIGAICLNAQGMALFNEVKPLPSFFKIFTSQGHCEALQDSDTGGVLGGAIDELIRHHPSLRQGIMDQLLGTIREIKSLGDRSFDITDLACIVKRSSEPVQVPQDAITATVEDDFDHTKRVAITLHIDILARFLEGLFSSANHARDFINAQGLQELISLYELKCLPYDFARSTAALALSQVFRIASEVSTGATLHLIYAATRQALQDCKYMSKPNHFPTVFAEGLNHEHSRIETLQVVALRRCHSYAVLLSDLYALPIFSHGRSALPLYQEFQEGKAAADLLQLLGEIHRATVWEDVQLSKELTEPWLQATRPPEDDQPASAQATQPTSGISAEELASAKFHDVKMIRFLLYQLPPCIVPFFQGVSKVLVTTRRAMDASHFRIAMEVAKIIAHILEAHLDFSSDHASDELNYPYLVSMLNVVHMILCDDRNPTNLTTSVLLCFDKALQKLCASFIKVRADLESLVLANQESRTLETPAGKAADRISATLEMLLSLFQQLTSHQAVLDSQQSQAIAKMRDPIPGGLPYDRHAFLVKMREQILVVTMGYFLDDSLAKSSKNICTGVLVILTQCISGEGEVPNARTAGEVSRPGPSQSAGVLSLATGSTSQYRSPVQREQNVSRLMALGFPRSVASSALTEANDNVQMAMDFLVAHPQFATPDAAAELNANESDAMAIDRANGNENDSDTTLEKLNSMRQELAATSLARSVAVLESQPDVVFELSSLVLASLAVTKEDEWVSEGVNLMIATLESMSQDTAEPQKAAHLGAITHLLAKLAHSDLFMQKAFADLVAAQESIRELLTRASDSASEPWVASAILVLDAILAQTDGPHAITQSNTKPDGLSAEQVVQIFDSCMAILRSRPADKGIVLSLCRFFVRLTRRQDLVARFISQGGQQELFRMLKQFVAQADTNIRITVMILLRHLVESEQIITSVMEQELKAWFAQPKARNAEVSTFVKQNAAIVLREPEIFVKTTERLCCFPKYDESTSLQAIALREAAHDKSPGLFPGTKEAGATRDKPVEVIQCILYELQASRERFRIEHELDSATASSANSKKTPFRSADHPEYLYRCLLLQCLTELLASYMSCKLEFINHSRKGGKDPTTPGKPRTAVLHFLMHDLLASASINVADDLSSKKRFAIEMWTRTALVSLCSNVSDADDSNEDESLQHIRKVVLDVVIKVIKDTLSSAEIADIRYAKLISLAELLYKLMTSSASSQVPQDFRTTTPSKDLWHTAKLMIEKDFVSLLSSVLANIDLQHPSARKVLKCVLRPLKALTKISIRLSETTDLVKPIPDQGQTEGHEEESNFFEESSSESSGESDGEDREDTPDLYRNSALGLFGGDMQEESENSSYMSNEEEEMYDEMDYDDEGSETGSAVSDEELEMSDTQSAANDQGVQLIGQDQLNSYGDDLDSDEEHPDDYSDYSDDMDAEEIEIIEEEGFDEGEWQDEEDDGADIEGDAPVSGDDLVIDITNEMEANGEELEMDGSQPEDEEDEDEYDESLSQEEEDMLDDENADDGEQWGWAVEDENEGMTRQQNGRNIANRLWASLSAGPGGGMRQSYEPDVQMFRGSRNTGMPARNTSSSDRPLLSNPLLADSTRSNNVRSGVSVRGESFTNWVDSIEALMRGGAVQLIGDMLQRPNARRGPQAIRVEVTGTGEPVAIATELDRVLQRSGTTTRTVAGGPTGPTDASGSSAQHEEDPIRVISFDSASTSKRWQDDATITFDGASIDRALRVIGKLLQAMQPRAKAEAAERKVAEEEENARIVQMRDAERERLRREKEKKKAEEQARIAKEQEQAQNQAQADSRAHNEEGNTSAGDSRPVAMRTQASGAMEGVEATGTAADQNTPRQVVSIRGQNVDITGLGIDIDFLNALPADMREEVLTQHIRDRRAAAQENSQQQAVELTPEFLEALPAEIRAELIQQEAADRRRRERLARQAQAQQASGRPAGPAEIDPASFLASLDPLLRQQVLMDMDQDDDLFSSLPPHLLAELAQVRAMPRDMERIRASRGSPSQVTAAVSGDAQKVKADEASAPKPKREAIQLLDKNGVVGLLRLVFLPLPQQKNVLHDVLLSLCENRQSRAEIISHLLLILQDGTADVHGAERCFNMMTKKARSTFTETPMKTPKRSAGPMQLPLMIGDNAPSLVALQTLQALSHLVHYNAQLATFFLTEHDTLAARRNAKAKGKGKESTSRASRFPINNLVSLLDRDVILSNSENLEQLSHLLSIVTRPLLMLKKRQKLERQESENVEMTTIESNPDQQESTIITTETTAGKSEAADRENKAKSRKALVPPEVPDDNLRLVVNILRANECSSKTFQNTLATMQHIGALPGAKQAVADELVKQAQALSQSIQSQLLGLLEHIRSLKADEEIQSSIFAPFSSGSSSQAKLLRILKSIDYLFEARRTELEEGTHAQQEQIGIVAKLEDSLNFGPLWSELSECLTIIHERSNMIHVATILLPLIEALMVVCKQITTSKEARISGSRQATPASGESLSSQFFNFTEQHRKILNQMVRNNPALMSGSFSLLVKNPKVLEFDNKRNYFVRKLRDKAAKEHYRPLALNVRREMIFLDSYKNLHFKSGDEIKYAKLNIRFAGEEGVDAGGVTREWFQVLARQMFDPNYALFVPVNADRNTYHPNKLSGVNPEHLSFFKFVGRIVGKALYDGRLLDCHFSRPVYRKMLGKNVSLKDMETLDLEYYKSLLWMLENDITDIITETFSVERDDFGEVTIVDLVPNGREIAVTEENKQEYVARVTQYRLLDSVSEQLEHFMKGFNDIIPPELVSIFNEQEIELLISGLPDIDADDWRNNTEYHNYTAASPQIQWFWRAVRSFDDEERARLLQFATGSSRIPVEGFANLEGMHGVQKFNIHRDYTHGDRLPQSHTCFNQLDLPEYDSYETLRNALLTAISEGNEGFGFA